MHSANLQGKLSFEAYAASWVEHTNLQGKVSQIGDHHLLFLFPIVLGVHIDAVDGMVKDLQVAAGARQLLRWDEAAARLGQLRTP